MSERQTEHGRGRLKIYLGMSAGVGKTYAMLSDALALAERGADIVAGYIEPHRRPDTELLAARIATIPTRVIEYGGMSLRELDLDAVVARRPELVLIDELAHTNAPTCRHTRRWQDVQELLSLGVSVWTTLNVQHLESLQDVVARITGVTVQETVPDSFVARADQIEIVDIPPEDLIERIREGKVYSADKVGSALENFFKKGNLIALRELMLRRAAERVDAQMREHRNSHAIQQLWPATERIVVCVAPNAMSARVVRAAGRLAQTLHAELIAISIENPRYTALRADQRAQASHALQVAENLGAEVVVRNSEDIVGAIVRVARERNATSIVVGKPMLSRWREIAFGSVVDELVRRSGEINVHVIPGSEDESVAPLPTPVSIERPTFGGIVTAGTVTALCSSVCALMYGVFDASNLVMVYLLGVAWLSSRFPRGDAVVCGVLSVLAFDFFFVEPRLTFAVRDAQYLVTFAVMLGVAVLISGLTQRLKNQTRSASDRESRTAALYELTRRLLAASNLESVAGIVADKARMLFGVDGVLMLPDDAGVLRGILNSESGFERSPNEQAVARWVFDRGEPAGAGLQTLSGATGRYIPLKSADRVMAVLAIGNSLSFQTEHDLLDAFRNQLTLAVERLKTQEQSNQSRLEVETERMRNALLSSVSHDLRTPLASITGSASVLRDRADLSPASRRDLALSIVDEAERLSAILRNVLDLTRLESGRIALKRDWESVEELLGTAASRVEQRMAGRDFSVEIGDSPELILVDGTLVEQLLVNLLDNALKYSPPGSPIELRAHAVGDTVVFEVCDRGAGIAPEDTDRVFERLFRANNSLGEGFGLGLTICRAIALAHEGSVAAENRAGGGSVFRVIIPASETPPQVPHG